MKVFTHGIGGAQDLPISLPFALSGGAAALAVSFAVLVLAWRRPRFDGSTGGRPVPAGLARTIEAGWGSWVLRLLGAAFAAYVVWAAVAGPDTAINPTFGVVYVWLWVGLVPMSLLFGPFYRAVNPLRTLHLLLSKVTGGDPAEGVVPFPAWVGLWPAAFGIFAFTWLELVYPQSGYLAPVRMWFAVYAAVVLVGAAVFGDRWIAAADPFEAYSTLVSHLSAWGRRADGTLVVRWPLQNLDSLAPLPGLLALTGILLGSTAFDSFKESLTWLRLTSDAAVDKTLLDTLALLVFWGIVAGLFALATLAAPAAGDVDRGELPSRFAPSLVPIIVGYVIAHYLTLLVEYGQQTLVYLSDPMGTGANLLGTADLQVSYWLSQHQTLLANIKVAAIVGGHVLGVVAAHDKAMHLLPRRHQLTGQLPLLLVMVGFTVAGLYLLLSV